MRRERSRSRWKRTRSLWTDDRIESRGTQSNRYRAPLRCRWETKVDSKLRSKLLDSLRRPSFAGSGLPERMRSTAFAFLGLTAAAGLALVAVFAQLGFSVLSPAPLPNAPAQEAALAEAQVVAVSPGAGAAGAAVTTAEPAALRPQQESRRGPSAGETGGTAAPTAAEEPAPSDSADVDGPGGSGGQGGTPGSAPPANPAPGATPSAPAPASGPDPVTSPPPAATPARPAAPAAPPAPGNSSSSAAASHASQQGIEASSKSPASSPSASTSSAPPPEAAPPAGSGNGKALGHSK
jgi:hypothetical protein